MQKSIFSARILMQINMQNSHNYRYLLYICALNFARKNNLLFYANINISIKKKHKIIKKAPIHISLKIIYLYFNIIQFNVS
jgi:hypothetical protein